MGIGDYLWPFQKSFSDIPCAREATLYSLGGGPIIGGLVLALTKRPLLAFKLTMYSGLGIFWLVFPVCRYSGIDEKSLTEKMAKRKIIK